MNYNEQDMAALISEVEAQFAEHLAKAEAEKQETLEKSEEVEEILTQAEETVEATEVTEEVQKSEEVEFDYDEEDIAEMDKMYASMSKSEAQAHLESIQKALGEESQESQTEEMTKSEEEVVEASESNELLKSELDTLKKENAELKKSFDMLTEALSKSVKRSTSAPKQKAITRIEYIAKSEDENTETKEQELDVTSLSKSEISKILSQKAKNPTLEKSDREKINQYYLEGGSIDNIKHLLV